MIDNGIDANIITVIGHGESNPVASNDTAEGRATNDPRHEARSVSAVEISTGHPTLFSDQVAPAVAPTERVTARSSNDPRGPLASPQESETTAQG